MICLGFAGLVGGQNTAVIWDGSGTGNVTTATNWNPDRLPMVSDDAIFSPTSASGIKNYGTGVTVGSPLTVGSLNVSATSGSYSIRNDTTSGTDAFLNLGGVGNLGNGVTGNAADLLHAAAGSTLQLIGTNSSGAGVLRVVLKQSGTFDARGTMVISASISDGGNGYSLTKTGGGTLTLSGANTYTGLTDVQAGTLILSGGSAIADGAAVRVSGGTLSVATSETVGAVTVSSGTISGSGTLTGSSFSFTNSGSVSAPLAGVGASLTKSGPGTVSLTGGNSYTGSTILESGNLSAGIAGALGNGGTIFFNGGTLQYSGAHDSDYSARFSTSAGQAISIDTINRNISFATALTSIGGTLTKFGSGQLTLGGVGANTYSGLTTVHGGILQLAKPAGVNAVSGDLTINGGTVAFATSSDNQIADSSKVTLGSGTFDVGARAETIGSLTMSGGTLSRGGNTLVLAGASSFTAGSVTMSSTDSRITVNGSLALGGVEFQHTSSATNTGNGLWLGGNVNYDSNQAAAAVFSNTSAGLGRINLQGIRTFDIADSNTLAAGQAEVRIGWSVQNGGLIKSGSGALELGAANTYTGVTQVNGGTLVVNGSLASGSSVTVSSDAKLAGTGSIAGATTIQSGGKYSAGALNAVGSQTFGSSLTFNNGSIFEWDLNGNSTENAEGNVFDTVSAVGAIAGGTTGTIFKVMFGNNVSFEDSFWNTPYATRTWALSSIFGKAFNSGGFQTVQTSQDVSQHGAFSISNTALTWTAVPEPGNAVAGALLAFGLLRRRR